MTHLFPRWLLATGLMVGVMAGAGVPAAQQAVAPAAAAIPSPDREFRAAWVATVDNIDWPSKPGLSADAQQAEAVAILDRLVELNMNAVVFQVRPQADALYKSDLEPWSAFLTGKQGQAPDPYYDPLEFWVAESHKRGIEFHTWFNPYRANHPSHPGGVDGLAPSSLVKAHPEMVVKLGSKGYYWMDPALQSVQDHSIAVVMDVVRRYDIDGVHFDDYFYPYWDYNDGKDFPDDASFAAYRAGGGALARNDWRREAVNRFIERLYLEIKAAKKHCKFGISPFGIWRPGSPASIQGYDQFDKLYADARLWLAEGWVDYYTPQLYWQIGRVPQSFPVLLGWWKDQNKRARHLWPGLAIGQGRTKEGAREIVNQIMITRGMLPDAPGNVFFSMKALQGTDTALAGGLLKGVLEGQGPYFTGPYAKRALVPASPWLDATPPASPEVRVKDGATGLAVSWTPRGKEAAFLWVVYQQRDGAWTHQIVPGAHASVTLEKGSTPVTAVAVSAVDRVGNESARTVSVVNVTPVVRISFSPILPRPDRDLDLDLLAAAHKHQAIRPEIPDSGRPRKLPGPRIQR